MSDLSMLMLGIGNEAFEDSDPYVSEVVDVTELESINNEARVASDNLVDSTQRLTQLSEAIEYGESVRGTITETEARELQSRVIAVLGEERGASLVGSVESYNGALSGQILNASLESLGGMLKSAVDFILKLIRNCIQIMLRFVMSAKRVLGNQLKAVTKLINDIRNREFNAQFKIVISGKGVTATTGNDILNDDPVSGLLTFREVATLSTFEDGDFVIPTDFVNALRETCTGLLTVRDVAMGINTYYDHVLSLLKESREASSDEARYVMAAGVTLDRCLPLSQLVNVRAATTQFNVVLEDKPMLGAKQLRVSAPPKTMYRGSGIPNGKDVMRGMASIKIELLGYGRGQAKDPDDVTSLSKADAVNTLELVKSMVESLLTGGYDDEAARLAKLSEQLVSRTLPFIGDMESNNDFRTSMLSAIGTLTTVTTGFSRMSVSYSNNLITAVRRYAELSAGLN